ncbi:MAG: STAS-like domain-containing protein [Mucilaginibacter sp.]
MATISIFKDFSEFPGLRNCDISENSGEDFYHKKLNAAFKNAIDHSETLIVDLDNTAGYASSFLDQAFGSLVYDFGLNEVKKRISLISEQEPHWKEMILNRTFPEWEKRRMEAKPPKVTIQHDPWYRLIGNKLELKAWEQLANA